MDAHTIILFFPFFLTAWIRLKKDCTDDYAHAPRMHTGWQTETNHIWIGLMPFHSCSDASHDEVVHLLRGTAVVSGEQTEQGSNLQPDREGPMAQVVVNQLLDHPLINTRTERSSPDQHKDSEVIWPTQGQRGSSPG